MGKMRLTYYAAASVTAAAAVILKAFQSRPNFYSAAVYLSQTPLCYMILLNLLMLCFGSILYGLQLLLFGHLRQTEVERLWERGWISVTETLLIMMTFRDDVGGWFLFVLTNLVVARLWAWIAEGRIEMLEQQPPANPRLFHARLSSSLAVSLLFNFLFLKYCIDTVLEEARPGMMVMFAFEFAVLTITSMSNLLRYLISLREIQVVKKQTASKIEARRAEIRTERERVQAEAAANGTDQSSAVANLPREEDVDENEVDVPGWEEKGRWVFALDLTTDFLRLVVYLAFFSILMLFHGIPIHIIRDVYVTLHSFLKRIYSFIQYRNATKDMNTRYPDATPEELQNENTCIVCREEMHQWQHPDHGAVQMEQRLRPKKLPCGHILHFGCLRSWLERQQVCPTCRRSVLSGQPTTNNPSGAQQQGRPGGQPAHAQGQAPGQAEGGQHPRNNHGANIQNIQNQNPNLPAQWRRRTFNLGPVRFEIGMGQMPVNAPNMLQGGQANPANLLEFQPQPTINLRAAPQSQRWDVRDPASIYLELFNIERNIAREIAELNVMQQQLGAVRALQAELARLRILQSQVHMTYQAQVNQSVQDQTALAAGHNTAEAGPSSTAPADAGVQSTLPPGMTLPEGWALLPLTRTEAPPQAFPALPLGFAPPQTNLAGLSATQVAQMQAAQAQAAQAHAQMLASQTQAAQPMLGNASVGGNGQPATNGQSGLPGVNGQREVSESTNGQPPQMVRVTSLFPPTGVPGVPTVAQQNAYQHGATTSGPSASANSSATPTGEASTTSGDQDTTSTILPASVPTWSFGDNVNGSQEQQPETSTMTTDSHAVEGESSELPNANGSAEGHVDKGKARAATVEDAQDDE